MDNLLSDMGKRLREYRKSLKMTQQKVAEILDMSLNFYGQIERGESRLSLEKMLLLHEKLGFDPTYLLTGKRTDATLNDFLADYPKDKIFELMEQVLKHAGKLYNVAPGIE